MISFLLINLNSLGLVLDIMGVILLWRYGIPNAQLASKDMVDVGWIDHVPEDKKKSHNRRRLIRILLDHLAYVLLFLGFLAQLMSNFIKH